MSEKVFEKFAHFCIPIIFFNNTVPSNELITNHGIPISKMVVTTGDAKGLEQIGADYKLGIADAADLVKFVITQKAQADGWDCPFCLHTSL